MKQKQSFTWGCSMYIFKHPAFRKQFFFQGLLVLSRVPGRSRNVYITVPVQWNFLLYSILHFHRSLFNMDQGQNLKGTEECTISKMSMNELSLHILKRRLWCRSSELSKTFQQMNKNQRKWEFAVNPPTLSSVAWHQYTEQLQQFQYIFVCMYVLCVCACVRQILCS